MNNKTLLLIFAVLLAIFGLSKFFSVEKDRSFNTNLIEVDTAIVTSVVLIPKEEEGTEITLKKEKAGWIVTDGNISDDATASSVNSILGQLALIETKRIAAKNPEKWSEYEVEEGNGSRVKVYNGEKLMEDFIVGRFNFNQQMRTATSFIRLVPGDEVYAVDGFLTMSFGQGFDSYRNKQLVKMSAGQEITNFSYNYGDTLLNFMKLAGQWSQEGQMALDSSKVENFLNALKNMQGTDFADDFDEVQSANLIYRILTLKGNNILEPITVSCYKDISREKPFVVNSSQNPDAYFESDSSGVYDRLFKNIQDFFPE
ncbi:MAG: DUF4340 domain-containing protein [Bacteroidetes bacterium]|nr:DUF4340 domain-containing protein [Bacteroidota bacterium]